MKQNQVIKTIKEVVGNDYREFLSGDFKIENKNCAFDERGGVYGIAVDLTGVSEEDKMAIYNSGKKTRNKVNYEDWKPIEGNIYPLYWGKDINLGSRLYEHTKNSSTVGSLQLNKRDKLVGKKVIYGAVLCNNRGKHEKFLHQKYPDIFQNIQDKKE